ncbi:MAG: hypothetical protein WC732_07015 [Candidatus Omnitrophota bacterium]
MTKKIPLIFGCPSESFYAKFNAPRAFVAELRPGLEGMKQVSGELLKKGVKPVVICDNMMAFCMERGLVSGVHIFSAQVRGSRALCRTGSLIAAICARHHGIPVVLHKTLKQPSAVSMSLLKIGGIKVASAKIKTYVPALEEIPLDLIDRTVEPFKKEG